MNSLDFAHRLLGLSPQKLVHKGLVSHRDASDCRDNYHDSYASYACCVYYEHCDYCDYPDCLYDDYTYDSREYDEGDEMFQIKRKINQALRKRAALFALNCRRREGCLRPPQTHRDGSTRGSV